MCRTVCPHRVFTITKGKVHITEDSCMECGACVLNCPANALEVNAGIGCAEAIIKGWFTKSKPSCDCSDSNCC